MAQPREFIDRAIIPSFRKRHKNGTVQAALDSLLGLGGPSTSQRLQDVVFVAIDFRNFRNIRHAFSMTNEPSARNCQLGISVLDTRDFFHTSPQHMLSTLNFSTGTLAYHTKALRRFRFGVSEIISIYDITAKVEEALSRKDKRDVILVCHRSEPGQDTKTINSLLISADARPPRLVLSATSMAQELFGHGLDGKSMWSLAQLVTELGMDHLAPIGLFHNAGNDANFTLRVLLMLAVRGYENRNITSSPEPPLVQILRDIINAPLPAPRSITEFERLLTLQPQEPLDDPAIPVDTSRFRGIEPKLPTMAHLKRITGESMPYYVAAQPNKVRKEACIPKKKEKNRVKLLDLPRCCQDDDDDDDDAEA